ncbi:hypothetical protein OEZ85_009192 [Tetradesmus obliquus]|uniref:Uncharacterized protein n=1 Tax=Tetradesmus obliquus TaxID=3088 RepID=A0ABY8TL28_TETOB|nr:hypothetical protein OEZ85_009192 [Tetradesmus obliquus]
MIAIDFSTRRFESVGCWRTSAAESHITGGSAGIMAEAIETQPQELGNPVPIILGVITFLVVAFVVVNYGLWYYAQQNAPAAVKPKKLGAKKAKRQSLKQGLQVLGD